MVQALRSRNGHVGVERKEDVSFLLRKGRRLIYPPDEPVSAVDKVLLKAKNMAIYTLVCVLSDRLDHTFLTSDSSAAELSYNVHPSAIGKCITVFCL